MSNLKIKTFTFEDNSIFTYNRNYEENDRRYLGEYYYFQDTDKIDSKLNTFLNDNNVEIVDIKINSITKGNNPPTSILIYTIIYKEMMNNENL